MQVRYQPAADRVLWQVRTSGGELFALWLTRRMMRQLWPPLQQLVTQAGVTQLAPQAAVLVPEAREMLAQTARERPLPQADFSQPFNPKPVAQPLGQEPLLPTAIDLGPGADGLGLKLRAREGEGRSLTLTLSNDLATALLRLLDKALAEADWGLVAPPAPAADAPPAPPPVLN